jgi:hypothetical protein
MTTKAKLRIHRLLPKQLCAMAMITIIKKTDTQKLETAQMRFLRTVLGLT